MQLRMSLPKDKRSIAHHPTLHKWIAGDPNNTDEHWQ
jgi:hypothetical protein